MRAGIVGIAVVVAIGLIWSVAVMSKLVPVDGSEMRSAATSPHVNDQALLIRSSPAAWIQNNSGLPQGPAGPFTAT